MSSISLNFKKGIDSLSETIRHPKIDKRLMWLLVAIPLFGIASYAGYHQLVTVPKQQAQNKIKTAAVTRGNLTVLVSANGTVQPESSVNISPKTPGVLKRLLVKEGDFVKPGQIVAYMDNSNLQGQLLQARGNVAAAQANLKKVIAGNRSQDIAQAQAQVNEANAGLQKLIAGNRSQDIAGAVANLNKVRATYRQAAEDLHRNQKLQAQGAISQQALSLARSTSDSAQAQVEQDQQALNLLKAGSRPEDIAQARSVVNQHQQALNLLKAGSRPEDISEARAKVMAAQGAVAIAQRLIDDTTIRAPFAGIIARKYADPGAFVTPTTAGSAVTSATSSSILALASTNEIVAQVAEASIAQIKVGQVATIKVDAYSGKTFAGKVTQVATQSLVQQNVTSFEVKVAVTDSQKLLSQGMNVTIDFKAGELNQVLLVPTAAIVQQAKAQGVFVAKTGGDPVFTPIVVGTTVNDKTEVKSGLTGNERVLLSFPPGTRKATAITDGG
ncbi:efflux RND transporter periplasmic adaptor subunit [Chamaesiphon sp. VAR_69_metabat_338]|uniref:efflux RND transporter periplasmic adaptor subunit n=1 Tax=Chamaesiphon sp. VAR_69_metabat_338 TaxID=2964704 RepID=UPI00286EAADC|nr:efflux RND transporter periplasmic adaptor subunit [Chamaesiphon sp. VAR_69_metabat_338]